MKKLALILLLLTNEAWSESGASFGVKVGPPTAGAGGSNPAGIPPSPLDMEFTFLTSKRFETNLSVMPGILFGKRIKYDGLYLSLGGGLLLDLNGVSPGAYTSFGYISGGGKKGFHYLIEYKQTAGISSGTGNLVSPGALRFGLTWVK